MGWLENLLSVASVGEAAVNAVKEDSYVKEVRETKEYQEEVENNIEQLREYPDEILLREFHEEYADGDGLVKNSVYTRTDPMFEAAMKVFKEREIVKLTVTCEKCNRTLGYRMAPKCFDKLENFSYDTARKLKSGMCRCKCRETYSWEICGTYSRNESESYISIRSLF